MDCSGSWLIPQISLQSEWQQELDRRAAAHLSKAELHELADDLIIQWYQHQSIIDRALGRIRQLEVEVVLAQAPPWSGHVSDEHMAMARELMAIQAAAQADQDFDAGFGGTPAAASRAS